MSNENMENPFDEFAIHEGFIFKRSDCSVSGCYRDGVEINRKDMNEQEIQQAHLVSRKYMFDIVEGK